MMFLSREGGPREPGTETEILSEKERTSSRGLAVQSAHLGTRVCREAFVELTWVAIAASLLMGLGAALVFIFAVKRDYFRNIEDVKYQVFWSDLEEMVDSVEGTTSHGNTNKDARTQQGR
jgi:hypothetical protein